MFTKRSRRTRSSAQIGCIMKIRYIACLSLLLPLSSIAQEDGTVLLQKVQNAYASLSSYEDQGLVTCVFSNRTEKIPFKTYFIQPAKVRFEFTLSHPAWLLSWHKWHYSVWSDGTNSFMAMDGEAPEKDSLYSNWGGAAFGISCGSSVHIPSFLLQHAMGSGVYKGKQWSVAGEDIVEGVSCTHAKIEQWKSDYIDVWVGKEDLLIRQIVDGNSTIRYISILTNSTIDESHFQSK